MPGRIKRNDHRLGELADLFSFPGRHSGILLRRAGSAPHRLEGSSAYAVPPANRDAASTRRASLAALLPCSKSGPRLSLRNGVVHGLSRVASQDSRLSRRRGRSPPRYSSRSGTLPGAVTREVSRAAPPAGMPVLPPYTRPGGAALRAFRSRIVLVHISVPGS